MIDVLLKFFGGGAERMFFYGGRFALLYAGIKSGQALGSYIVPQVALNGDDTLVSFVPNYPDLVLK